MITEPTVRVLASTRMNDFVDDVFEPDVYDADGIATFAGRSCYESYSRPNPATARDFDYLQRTLHSQHHFSIAEHAGISFYITGVSRSLTHELVRHRHLGYSQLSQRYVDSAAVDWVCPPVWLDDPDAQEVIGEHFEEALILYRKLVLDGEHHNNLSRKKAREAARAVLPNCTETKIVVSGNYRSWFEVVGKRYSNQAEAEIDRLFSYIVPILKQHAPGIFHPVEENRG